MSAPEIYLLVYLNGNKLQQIAPPPHDRDGINQIG